MSAPAPPQDFEFREFDPENYQQQISVLLGKLTREQTVSFASRCAWRAWPLAIEFGDSEWVARFVADLTAAIIAANGFHILSFRERYHTASFDAAGKANNGASYAHTAGNPAAAAAQAASYAAYAAYTVGSSGSADSVLGCAVQAFERARSELVPQVIGAIEADLHFLLSGGSAEELIRTRLWEIPSMLEWQELVLQGSWSKLGEHEEDCRRMWEMFAHGRPDWETAGSFLQRWHEGYLARENAGDSTTPADAAQSAEPEPEEIVRIRRELDNPPVIQHDGIAESLTDGAKRCAEALRVFLTAPGTRPPLTVAVEAPWGGGKSSLMRHVQKQLAADGHPTVWFNPWKYEAGRSLWAAFALALERQLAQRFGRCDRGIMWMQTVFSRLTWKERMLLAGRVSFWVVLIGVLAWAAKKGVLSPGVKKEDLWDLLKSYSPLVGVIAAIWGFIRDVTKQLGSPLKLDMETMITGAARSVPPDELHRFHQDFRRLLRAYLPPPNPGDPPRRTVIVFIDDLDRCEAPKAADLLQSLHLLMDLEEDERNPCAAPAATKPGVPEPGMIYILGMDREKVAAAVSAKHEKLLELLYDPPAGQTKITRKEKMSFGHEFLEKFINLTLHLPAMQGTDLESFSRQITGWKGEEPKPTAPAPVDGTSKPGEAKPEVPNPTPPPDRTDSGLTSSAMEAAKAQLESARRIQRIREEVQKLDVATTLKPWVRKVAAVLENNPRKLKQFVNLLRLRLYLASAARLLHIEEGASTDRLTVGQLAKLVALELADPAAMATVREQGGSPESLRDAFQNRPGCQAWFSATTDDKSADNLMTVNLSCYFHSLAPEPA
jgi:hypothetical protein